MMPRLQASDQLDAFRASGLAFGSFPKDDARAMLDRLREAAFGPRPRARKASAAELAAIGIGRQEAPSAAAVNASSEGSESRNG